MPQPLKVAVIGVGYLGALHAQKWAAHADAQLACVVDADPQRAQQIASLYGCDAQTQHTQLPPDIDAVSIAVPTAEHFAVADALLRRGIHVLVEKPITSDVRDAQALVKTAQEQDLTLQCGHLERFNRAFSIHTEQLAQPDFIEANRLASFTPRGADVNVVLDLMIHDIDLVLALTSSAPTEIRAAGARLLTTDYDIVNARLEFACGCVANLTASRISQKRERIFRVFKRQQYTAMNLDKGLVTHTWLDERGEMSSTHTEVGRNDAIAAEIDDFVHAIASNSVPRVDGQAGLAALEIAEQIRAALP